MACTIAKKREFSSRVIIIKRGVGGKITEFGGADKKGGLKTEELLKVGSLRY